MNETNLYLRTQDETFGPESRDRLIEWAKLGRIQPGQEVSEDNVVWRRVEEVPFLDMRFSIDLGDGKPRGPFNRAAAEALLASGRLPPTARMVEVRPPFEEPSAVASESAAPEPVAPVEPTVIEKVVEKVVVDETRIRELEAQLVARDERETKLVEQIRALEDELRRLPQAASEVADLQTAVYSIVTKEAEEIQALLEREKRDADEFRRLHQERTDRLLERRRELLKRAGNNIEDMTRKSLLARPEDPRTAQLRKELEDFRRDSERQQAIDQSRIRELEDAVRVRETELRRAAVRDQDLTQLRQEAQELREKLQLREKELLKERETNETLRRNQALSQQALITRLAQLESPSIAPAQPPETNQSREAKMVKLPSWMRLKR